MKYKDIPEYLHNSEFYLNLDPSGEEFDIPFDIPEEIINNIEDFNKMYKIINFFGAKYPDIMKNYWVNNLLEIMKEYLDFGPENKEMFQQFIFVEINNFEQFESVSKLIKFYNFFLPDNYVEYGLKNKNEYIEKNSNSLSEELKNTLDIEIKWDINYKALFLDIFEIKIHFNVKDNPMFQKIFRRISVCFGYIDELNKIIDDYEIIIYYLKNGDFSKNLDRGPIKIFDKIFYLRNEFECYQEFSFEFPITYFNSKIVLKYLLDMFEEFLEELKKCRNNTA
uniref:Uncharacterized protein n=1 Tax=viral metagenome TaxID=1070528 RepID=A0A6C0ADR6_9ZZZZ